MAGLTDEDEIDHETTAKSEPFRSTVVSRKSVADQIARIIKLPARQVHANLGVNKPSTNADKFYFT